MFWSSTNFRDLALNLAKVIFILKHSVKLHRYLLCGCVAACHGMVHVLYAVQNATVCVSYASQYRRVLLLFPTIMRKEYMYHSTDVSYYSPKLHVTNIQGYS